MTSSGISEVVGNDIDIQVSTENGDEILSGIIIDVREMNNGSAEMDICLECGDIATIALSPRQYAGLLGQEEDAKLPQPN